MSSEIDVMKQRYSRALRRTAPKVAAEIPGIAVEGYWIDESQFFFLAERFERSLGHIVASPSIANVATNTVKEVVPSVQLAGILSERSELLACAKFDLPSPDTLAVSVGNLECLIDARQGRIVQSRAALEVPALYSPNRRFACFVKGHDLWLRDRDTGEERPLTTGGIAHHCYGQESETCLSAVTYRERPYPVGLWSPDSQWFITHRIDERSLPDLPLIQHAPPSKTGHPRLHTFKCSMAGDKVPVATYIAIHVTSGRIVAFDDFSFPVPNLSTFFSRMIWFGADNEAWCIRRDRYWKHLELIRLDLTRGTGRIVLSEASDGGYLDLHPFIFGTPNVRTLPRSDEVIWYSERDGWGHLYLYDASTGVLKNRITTGEWLVRDVIHVDEGRRQILFLGSRIDSSVDPARRFLCTANFDSSGIEVLIADDYGDIYVQPTEPCGLEQSYPFRPSAASPGVSPGARFAVVRRSSAEWGNRTEIVDLRTRRAFPIASAAPEVDEVRPRHFTALAADGVTRLHGTMFFPSDFDERRRYPLIDYIYPGPHISQQPQSFRSMNSALSSTLAELGFVTIMLDTRGLPMAGRDRKTHV